jgi:hypothetical protein
MSSRLDALFEFVRKSIVAPLGRLARTRRLLIAREVLRLDDLALVQQASAPELLPDFGRWQDVVWRRDTLALH